MTRLRKSIIFMIIYLSFVYNIERVDVSGKDVINIQSFVYVLIGSAILATIISRILQRYSVYFGIFFWNGIYLGLKIFVITYRPLFGDVFTYLTITEIALLTISVFLAYDLAHSLVDFEEVVERVTFPKHGQRIVDMKEANEDVKTEFVRSRRHNRPLSILLVKMGPKGDKENIERAIKSIQKTMVNRYILTSLARIISKEARRTDLIIQQNEKDGFILLCPETTAEGSFILAERIQNLAMDRLGIKVNCGIASFPDEALTFEALLQKAEFNALSPGMLSENKHTDAKVLKVDHHKSNETN